MSHIKGTCMSMCPNEEIEMREKANLVHALEIRNSNNNTGPNKILVKCYSRSAADTNMAIPHLLRPFPVLKQTVKYLVHEISKRKDVPTPILYDFISNRFRSVRQDTIIQQLPPEECVVLLEPMIRFHVYYGYILCECPTKDFDSVLNKKYLLECLKWFLNCWDDKEAANNVENLTKSLLNMELNNKDELLCDNILMESLYILCNLDDIHPIWRYLMLSKNVQRFPILKRAFDIAIANWKGNFVKVFKLAENLCPLTYCAFSLHVPKLQRKALEVMSTAFNSKQLTVPCSALTKMLWFNSDEELIQICQYYGLRAKARGIIFSKTGFRTDIGFVKPKKRLLCDKKLTNENIFTYSSQ